MRAANFAIIEDTDDVLCLQDLGPWDRFQTITNAAEDVVKQLAPVLRGRRLEYIDSEGQRDQILVRDGRFIGFGLTGDLT